MNVKILRSEKDVIEVDLGSIDQSIAQMISEKLNKNSDVEFAAYKVDHPTVGTPKVLLRVKKGDATKIFLATVKEVKEEIEEFSKKFQEICE
jgi:DNA-directed RNA polymerase subunit L